MTVFTYNDYKKYLLSWLKGLQKQHGELVKIADYLQIKSSYLSQVFKGDKHFSLEQGIKLSKYLGLNELEQEYFICLIEEARAGSSELEEFHKKRRSKILKKSEKLSNRLKTEKVITESDQAIFYSHWSYSVIRLLTSLPEFKNEQSIAKFLNMPLIEIRKRTEFLLKTGLIVQEKGNLSIGPNYTHLSADSPLILRHHANWRQFALHQMEKMKSSDLAYSAPLTISKKDKEVVREKIIRMLEEIKSIVKDTNPETMMCLGIDFLEIKN